MTSKNPYRKNAHLGVQKSRKIIKFFAEDITTTKTSELLGIDRNTVNSWYSYIRDVVFEYAEKEKSEVLGGVFELDESYFGPTRVRGKRGRGAGMKTIVFGLLKRNGKVYTEIIPDAKSVTLKKIIRGKISPESEINTDGWKGYNGLVDVGYDKHYRVNHGNNEFARGKQHVNGIESFWSFAKRRLSKFNGILKEKFAIHLKETEFRFNCGLSKQNIYKCLLKILKDYVKKSSKLV